MSWHSSKYYCHACDLPSLALGHLLQGLNDPDQVAVVMASGDDVVSVF